MKKENAVEQCLPDKPPKRRPAGTLTLCPTKKNKK